MFQWNRSFILNRIGFDLDDTFERWQVLELGGVRKVMTYVGEDAVALLTNAALQTEGQVVAADDDASAKTLLKRFHIWLDA